MKRKRAKRRGRRNPSGFWAWASEHWIISGFFLFPALIWAPVAIIQALRRRGDAGNQLVTAATAGGTVTTTRANAPDANVPISFEA